MRFSNSSDQSRLYFTKRLTNYKYIKSFIVLYNWISFSILIFIKHLTNNLLK